MRVPMQVVCGAQGKQIGTKFLAMEHSFHGRSMGSVATTHKEKYREPFAPVMPGVEFVRFNDVDDLRSKFSDEVCAICIEPFRAKADPSRLARVLRRCARTLRFDWRAVACR